MQPLDNQLKRSLIVGLAKGWGGFVWMLKILVPISFLTSLLTWSGWIDRLDFILEPLMGMLGLPPMAALPLLAGLLTGIYGAIAAMAPLPLTVDHMTLLAVFLLISHNLVQEGVVQSQSGFSFWKATVLRLLASIVAVMILARIMGPSPSLPAPVIADSATLTAEPFLTMVAAWARATLILGGKILVIIVALMVMLELMKSYRLIDRLVYWIAPGLKVLGLGKRTGFLWLTAAVFGLTYGAAVIVEEVKGGHCSPEELQRLHLSIGINHAMIEDTALFVSLGLGLFWLMIPRITAAIIAVQLYIVIKRLVSRSKLSRIAAGHQR
jgi:hypothetical protein